MRPHLHFNKAVTPGIDTNRWPVKCAVWLDEDKVLVCVEMDKVLGKVQMEGESEEPIYFLICI